MATTAKIVNGLFMQQAVWEVEAGIGNYAYIVATHSIGGGWIMTGSVNYTSLPILHLSTAQEARAYAQAMCRLALTKGV